ncbi:MAG: hypothetical protein A2X49_17390 [Lentisphaerae bacterium GWF2_52_8]|nr:MAG: hypothetical protein A2X49_17390 [Lentisphaerae bacterium GWF2_52_8]
MKKLLTILSGAAAASLLACSLLAAGSAEKKLNSINCAKILAERNIVETVYGIKIKFDEEVTNILEGAFTGTTETKTGKRMIKGIEFEAPKYDSKRDIAQVTATLRLANIGDIVDREKFNIDKYPDKVIKRVAFATSTPENARKIAALRAAEIDAYKNLYKRIGGFTLESHSSVQNFILKSDKVKASVIGAIMGAEFVGFDWDGEGDEAIAIVKLRVNTKELSEMLGEKIIDCDREFIETEGQGVAAKSDKPAQPKTAETKPILKTDVIEGDIKIAP